MRFNAARNRSRYYHLTINGWIFGTFVDSAGTLHEIERPPVTVYTIYVQIEEEFGGVLIEIKERCVSDKAINEFFEKFGNYPANITSIP
ncbi:MAG: hypothetical protein PUP93_13755 [Rhizonema sp. NSF051]|nr:hypothetical protein [Rhizonema sp. NSF051]